MKCEVLMSTMNKKSMDDLIKNSKVNNCIIVNQVTKNTSVDKNVETGNQKFISYNEKGLSKSRNRLLSKSKADICIIADDDMYYVDNYEQIIKEQYNKHPNADMIAFVVQHENKLKRKKVLKEGYLSLINTMKLQSVQITFKRKSVVLNKIKFDENFGAGAKYPWGEENIFLFDCKRKKLKIYYVPIKIATLKDTGVSSWDKSNTVDHYNRQGIIYYRMSKRLYKLLIIQFVLRKRKIYSSSLTSLQVLKAMFEGVKKHKRGLM